jgi:molecular chaperone DnaJ
MRSADAAAAEVRPGRDYYDVLGVHRTADDTAIRQAYLRRARDLHPDVSKAPDAEARFQELSAAYAVLSDPNARLLYDRFGYRGLGSGFNAGQARASEAPILAELNVDTLEAARGASRKVRFSSTEPCEACEGDGLAPGRTSCKRCDGKGTLTRSRSLRLADWVNVEKCPDCDGDGIPAADRCPECGGTGSRSRDQVIKVRIPAGVEDGTRLRLLGDHHEEEHLLVQVEPLPRDSLVIRLLAGALLVCSVALLAYFLSL